MEFSALKEIEKEMSLKGIRLHYSTKGDPTQHEKVVAALEELGEELQKEQQRKESDAGNNA